MPGAAEYELTLEIPLDLEAEITAFLEREVGNPVNSADAGVRPGQTRGAPELAAAIVPTIPVVLSTTAGAAITVDFLNRLRRLVLKERKNAANAPCVLRFHAKHGEGKGVTLMIEGDPAANAKAIENLAEITRNHAGTGAVVSGEAGEESR